MPFKQSLKVLFTSENFLALLVGFSLINGTFSYFGAAINFILVPFNYTDVLILGIVELNQSIWRFSSIHRNSGCLHHMPHCLEIC